MNKQLNFFRFYLLSEIFYSFLISFLFFALPTSLVIAVGIETLLLMIPKVNMFAVIMWVLLEGILVLSTKVLIDTFKNYKEYDEFDYKLLYWLLVIVFSCVITIGAVILTFIF